MSWRCLLRCGVICLVMGMTIVPGFAHADSGTMESAAGSSVVTEPMVDSPSVAQWRRMLLLQDYNTRIVLTGTALLGAAAGAVGSFTLLRKRALLGDALSHATLPGIGIAFLVGTSLGGNGKSLLLLLAGATISGVLGLAVILLIRNSTRLKEDTALGIVLSVFFGAGIAVLGLVQQTSSGHAAGLEAFIYGKTASLNVNDAFFIAFSGVVSCLACLLMFKELKLLCFDEQFAASRGYPVVLLDLVLMSLVVAVTIVGLQAVGLVLVIALLVIPPSAARFWTQRMGAVAFIAAGIGAISALVGTGLSAVFPRLPSGPMIVLVATTLFGFSMIFGGAKGLLRAMLLRWRLNELVHRQHVLRAAYEWLEARHQAPRLNQSEPTARIPVTEILPMRSWSAKSLRRYLRSMAMQKLVVHEGHLFHLTPQGARDAAKHVHDHRLWELYLIAHADTAPAHVDRGADAIEHVLDSEIVAELEELLQAREKSRQVPPSPHPVIQDSISENPGSRLPVSGS